MSEVLAEIQAGYTERARMAALAPVSPPAEKVTRRATRTYTGQALARRRAWGLTWGSILKAHAHELRNEGERSV